MVGYNLTSIESRVKRVGRVAVLFVLALVSLVPGCGPKPTPARDVASSKRWVYVIPASLRAGDLERRFAGVDVVCVGVYRVDGAGRITTRPAFRAPEREWIDSLREGRALYPLIALRGPAHGGRLLENPTARARAIRELDTLVRRSGYDGLHIDFEGPTGTHAPAFAEFLKEVRATPAMKDKVLSVAVFPPLHRHPQEAAFHDLARIGPLVDQVVLMTYDYHLERPGPVTDLAWAEENVKIALRSVAADRLWLGVPGYGYEWPAGAKVTTRPRVITETRARSTCARIACERHPSGMLRWKSAGRVAFAPDPRLRANMAALARRMSLRGTALWRVGFELASESR